MRVNTLVAALLFGATGVAHAYSFLNGYDEARSVEQAVQRIKDQPDKHVLIYFGKPKNCPQCNYTRNILNGGALAARWKAHYVVVNIDIFDPTVEQRAVIEKYNIRWAPVLAFLDRSGKRVAHAKQLRNEKEALLLDEYVSQKLYVKTDFARYYAANFEAKGAERVVPETRVAAAPAKIDDRPRLRDVLAQSHERVTGYDLRRMLPGMRMHKENQDWYLELDLKTGGALEASGSRKDGKDQMRGPGKWYITKKGKLCLDIKSASLDEDWCRHVFRAGEGYYAVKDLRPERLAYRFTLEKT